jgi:hypothetical protein
MDRHDRIQDEQSFPFRHRGFEWPSVSYCSKTRIVGQFMRYQPWMAQVIFFLFAIGHFTIFDELYQAGRHKRM